MALEIEIRVYILVPVILLRSWYDKIKKAKKKVAPKAGIDLCKSGCLHADKWSPWWPGCLGFLATVRWHQVASSAKT